MGNQFGGIIVKTDQAFYTVGDQVTGNVYLNVQKFIPLNVITLNIYGIEQCQWLQKIHQTNAENNNHQVNAQNLQGKNLIYNHKFNIFQNQHEIIKPGGYLFPFSFQLDQYLPGTFQQITLQYKAKIQYKISVECISHINKQSFKSEQELIIRQQNRNEEIMYGEMIIKPRTFFYLKQGRCKIKTFFEKNTYLPGEDALILCQIDNLYCNLDIEKIDFILYKYITLRSDQGIQKQLKEIVNQGRLLDIESGRMFKGDFAKRRLMKIYNKIEGKILPPSTHGKLITCKYQLEISCVMLGCLCGQQIPNCTAKLELIPPPIKFNQIIEPHDWNPKIFQEQKIFLTGRQRITQNPLLNIMRTDYFREKELQKEKFTEV